MAQIRLKYDPNRFQKEVTLDELIESEEGKVRGMRDLLAHFLTDAEGKYLTPEDAYKQLGKLTVEEVTEVAKQFREAMENDAIPPDSDGT